MSWQKSTKKPFHALYFCLIGHILTKRRVRAWAIRQLGGFMRIWDVAPKRLCRQHLLGEHRELHAIWSILTKDKKGYSKHPETLRWRGKLNALYKRHQDLVREMGVRGYIHRSPLSAALATGKEKQDEYVDSYERQVRILQDKGCVCNTTMHTVT